MRKPLLFTGLASLAIAASSMVLLQAQESTPANRPDRAPVPNPAAARPGAPGQGSFPNFGPGGFMRQERKLVSQFDKNGDGRLNKDERQAAREFLNKERAANPGRGFGFPGGPRGAGRFSPATRPAGDNFAPPPGAPEGFNPPPGGFGPPPGAPIGSGPATRPAGDGFAPPGGPAGRRGPGGFGPPGGFGRRNQEPPKPGPRVAPADVKIYPDSPLYEPTVLRTLFLEFENPDWETELVDFHGTDVDVPATLTVDGKKFPDVGVHFRGASSYMMVGAGYKRSLNLSLDHADSKQRLYGYKTLNLLNCNGDPSFLRAAIYSHIARQYIPAPKVNLVKVVINGESWGIYANAQQYNKEFTKEFFREAKGVRWKVPGSPGARGSLAYIGDNVEDYKRIYEIKTDEPKEAAKAWNALITLCRTLKETPSEQLEAALSPMLDIDGVLWFLAIENVLINSDGYWIRTSDYNLFLDRTGKFHITPHDMNEALMPAGGPGFGRGGGQRGSGIELDPLVAMNDPNKVLLNRLLAVPSLKARYLDHVRTIAERSLDWNKLKPMVDQYRSLIEKDVEADTRKLDSFAAFTSALAEQAPAASPADPRRTLSLKDFVEQRRQYLLNHPQIKKAQ